MSFSWVAAGALFILIVGLIGLKFLSEWKQSINTFMTSIAAVLGVVVVDLTAMPYLTSQSAPLVIAANVITFGVVGIGVWTIWNRRVPKIARSLTVTLASVSLLVTASTR